MKRTISKFAKKFFWRTSSYGRGKILDICKWNPVWPWQICRTFKLFDWSTKCSDNVANDLPITGPIFASPSAHGLPWICQLSLPMLPSDVCWPCRIRTHWLGAQNKIDWSLFASDICTNPFWQRNWHEKSKFFANVLRWRGNRKKDTWENVKSGMTFKNNIKCIYWD